MNRWENVFLTYVPLESKYTALVEIFHTKGLKFKGFNRELIFSCESVEDANSVVDYLRYIIPEVRSGGYFSLKCEYKLPETFGEWQ